MQTLQDFLHFEGSQCNAAFTEGQSSSQKELSAARNVYTEKAAGEMRKRRNEKLPNLKLSPSIISLVKPRMQ
jgi:hypothetical protein